MKINDFKLNNDNEISMGFNNYLGKGTNFNETYLDKTDSINDVYLNLDDINKM